MKRIIAAAIAATLAASAVAGDMIRHKDWAYFRSPNKAGLWVALTQSKTDAMAVLANPKTGCVPFLNFIAPFKADKGDVSSEVEGRIEARVDDGEIHRFEGVHMKVHDGVFEIGAMFPSIEAVEDVLKGSVMRVRFVLKGGKATDAGRYSLAGSLVAVKGTLAQCFAQKDGGYSRDDNSYFPQAAPWEQEPEQAEPEVKIPPPADGKYYRM